MGDKSVEELKQEAIEAGIDLPEDPSGNDAMEDVAEVEVIDYGDSE